MNTEEQPFFFNDKKFISDVTLWKELLAERSNAGEKVSLESANNETNILNAYDAETAISFYTAVVKAHVLFLKMTSRIIDQVYRDKELTTKYKLFTIPISDVVGAQIFQHIFENKSLEELLQMVKKESEMIDNISNWIKKNDEAI